MKANVIVSYYREANGEFEVQVQEEDHDYFIVYYNNWRTDEPQTEIQDIQEHDPCIKVPDLTILDESEFFQASLLWDEPCSIYFVLAVQKYLKFNIQYWTGYETFEMTLEY